jgi:hypothetical protein
VLVQYKAYGGDTLCGLSADVYFDVMAYMNMFCACSKSTIHGKRGQDEH